MNLKKVAAAIIMQDNGILITQRPETDRLSLKWEFPGGKVETGETPKECLVREIKEELNLDIEITGHFMNSQYRYANGGGVELMCYLATIRGGQMRLNFHAAARWVTKNELGHYTFAPADMPVVTALQRA